MKQKTEQIKYNIECLNIDKIESVLKHLGVKWVDSSNGDKITPTKKEIKYIAKYCMLRAFESDDNYFEIGGFEANVVNDVVEIKFVIDKSNTLSRIFG